jgi:hypothetical protein
MVVFDDIMAESSALQRLQQFPSKPRVFILTDISNEPDDAESLVRYLLYTNQFRTEGIVAVTSTWLRTHVCPEDIHKILDAYEHVVDNLNNHTHPSEKYPSAASLRSLVRDGAKASLVLVCNQQNKDSNLCN